MRSIASRWSLVSGLVLSAAAVFADEKNPGSKRVATGPIPSLTEWGFILLGVLLVVTALFYLNRGRQAKATAH